MTVTDKLPYLQAAGIPITAISAVTGQHLSDIPGIDHHQHLPWGPAGLRFDLRHYFQVRWGKSLGYKWVMGILGALLSPLILLEKILIGFANQWSWSLPACWHGYRFIRQHPDCVLYSSGGSWSAHLAGYWLKQLTGVTWLAEIHDPLVEPGVTLSSRELRMRAKIEAYISEASDLAWWFTPEALASAKKRHPHLGDRGCWVLAGSNPPKPMTHYHVRDTLNFAYFGSLSPTRSLMPFLKACLMVGERHANFLKDVRIHCYGNDLDSLSQATVAGHPLAQHITQHGRLDRSHPMSQGRGSREQSLDQMHTADVLILNHGQHLGCAEYIPSKLFDYFWSARPILGMTYLNLLLDQLLRERGHWVCEEADISGIAAHIEAIWQAWQANGLPSKNNLEQVITTQQAAQLIIDTVQS